MTLDTATRRKITGIAAGWSRQCGFVPCEADVRDLGFGVSRPCVVVTFARRDGGDLFVGECDDIAEALSLCKLLNRAIDAASAA